MDDPEADHLRRTASDLTSLGVSIAVLRRRYPDDATLLRSEELVARMQVRLSAVIEKLKG